MGLFLSYMDQGAFFLRDLAWIFLLCGEGTSDQYTFRKRRNEVTRQKERERYLMKGGRLDKVGTD